MITLDDLDPELTRGRQPRRQKIFDGWERGRSGLYLPADLSRRPLYGEKPIAVDLFCGCGGSSLGFIQAGFRVVAALDFDGPAALTYMHNLCAYPVQIHYVQPGDKGQLDRALRQAMKAEARETGRPEAMILAGHGWLKHHSEAEGVPHFFFGDARRLKGRDILDALELKPGEIDCVMGGPPCQGFSIAGKRDVMDPRNSLVFEFARLVLEINPKTFVMENVPGLVSMRTPDGVLVLDALCRAFEDGGFGSREAIKRALLATAGLNPGMAMRGKKMLRPQEEEAEEESGEQLALAL